MPAKRPESYSDAARTARYAQAAIIVLGFFVFVITISGFWVLRYVVQLHERSLVESLEPVAQGIAEPTRPYFWFLPLLDDPETGELLDEQVEFYRELEDWRALAFSLRSAETLSSVASVHLLTTNGETIMDSEGHPEPLGLRLRFLTEDRELIASAAHGDPASSRLTRGAGPKRLYYPLRDQDREVLAIVRVQVDMSTFELLVARRNQMLVGFIAANLILVALYFLTMRLVRRTIEAERAVSQADRLRALGTMTAGIAHEIRNPLGIISLQIEELRDTAHTMGDEKQRGEISRVVHELHEETKRLRDLTETFLNFSKASSTPGFRPVPVNVDGVVEPLVKIWSKGLEATLRRVDYKVDAPGAHVLFTEDRLRQAVLNLLRNADEALGPQAGNIAVTVSRNGSNVEITVEDDGPGVSPSEAEQIFDPFYTTRAEGTGLGLSLSRAMARAAGGDLLLHPGDARGAAFTLRLPSA